MPNKYQKFKIHGKPRGLSKKRVTTEPVGIDTSVSAQKFSPVDQEIVNEVNKFHVFMTQRGIPYIAVARCPESGFPAGQYSFNHEHNKPEQTHRNAEWTFAHLGDMVKQATNGVVRLFRSY